MRGILRSGLSALLRGGAGASGSHGRHPSLRDEPGAGQLVHGGGVLRHPSRGIGRTRDMALRMLATPGMVTVLSMLLTDMSSAAY
ncbi:MAG: hypothetical protein ACLR7Z_01845 [Bilophila wadsworthia]